LSYGDFPEQVKAYNSFAVGIAKKLGAVDFAPDKILWHYTTGSSLLAIIESSSLFATQVSCLNDSTEIRYASKLLQGALDDLRSTFSKDSVAHGFIDNALLHLQEDSEFPAHAGVPLFCVLF